MALRNVRMTGLIMGSRPSPTNGTASSWLFPVGDGLSVSEFPRNMIFHFRQSDSGRSPALSVTESQ